MRRRQLRYSPERSHSSFAASLGSASLKYLRRVGLPAKLVGPTRAELLVVEVRASRLFVEVGMADPLVNIWPLQGTNRSVVNAAAEAVEPGQDLYRISFLDSSGRKLFVQVPGNALTSIVQSGAELLRVTP